MTAPTNLSDLLNRMTAGNNGNPEILHFSKEPRISGTFTLASAPVVGSWTSLWEYTGSPCGWGYDPVLDAGSSSISRVCSNTTFGSLEQTDPSGGRQKWLLSCQHVSSTGGTFLIYDRLSDNSGLDGTLTTPQSVGSPSLTRYSSSTDCVGNQIWLEIYNAVGVTPTTVQVSYTNQSGTSGQLTRATTFGGTGLREAQRMIPLILAAGDTGVQTVSSVTLAGSTGTQGSFGVTILHPISYLLDANLGLISFHDNITASPGFTEIKTGACLAFAMMPLSTTQPVVYGNMNFIEA